MWTIGKGGGSDAASRQLAALRGIVGRCLSVDPAARLTPPALMAALTDVKAMSASLPSLMIDTTREQRGATAPSPLPTAGLNYDVLAILDAMESHGVASEVVDTVSDAIGHLGASSLEILRTHGIPARTIVNLRRGLQPITSAHTFADPVRPSVR